MKEVHGSVFSSKHKVFYTDDLGKKRQVIDKVELGRKIELQIPIADFKDENGVVQIDSNGKIKTLTTEDRIAYYTHVFEKTGKDSLLIKSIYSKIPGVEIKDSVWVYFFVK